MELIGADVSAVVLDSGSHTTKFGYGGESSPQSFFSTKVGVVSSELPPAKRQKLEHGASPNPKYVLGRGFRKPLPHVEVKQPFSVGEVKDWDAFEKVWDFCYNGKLQLPPEEHPLLMTECAWNTSKNREKAVEIAFEKFQTPAFFLSKQDVLSCYAVGRGTGLVVNSGHQYTSVVPVYEGHILKQPVLRTRIAGEFLNNKLETTLRTRGVRFNPPCILKNPTAKDLTQSFLRASKLEIIEEIKQTTLRINSEGFENNKNDFPISAYHYKLPDGKTIKIQPRDRLSTPETIFSYYHQELRSTDLDEFKFQGLDDMIRRSLSKVDPDARKEVSGSIVISGGTTALDGFQERLAFELQNLPHALKPRIVPPHKHVGHEAEFCPWVGGSILSSLGFFQTFWIYPSEYKEEGKRVVHRKCP